MFPKLPNKVSHLLLIMIFENKLNIAQAFTLWMDFLFDIISYQNLHYF